LALIVVGIGFKLSLVPFHLWTPDVYQGAPLPITAFLSTGSKVAVIAALLRISLSASDMVWLKIMPILWMLAALTMVVGNVTALTQNYLKRLLAYSSAAQMGYLLMALVAVKSNGASAVLFYAAVYALMDLGAFGTLTMMSPQRTDLDVLTDCRGLGYEHPWRAALLAVCLFSLAGLPPTAGFMGKFLLFRATIEAGFVGTGIDRHPCCDCLDLLLPESNRLPLHAPGRSGAGPD
jgi:NADH-quinone oxidoreductase subunit N